MWVPVFGDSRCGLFPGGSGAFGVGGGMVLDGSGWFCRLFDVGDTPFNFLFLKLQLTSGCRRWMFLQENACRMPGSGCAKHHRAGRLRETVCQQRR